LVKEVGEFFVNYHRQDQIKFKVLGTKGAKEANQLLQKAVKKGKAA
jgi:hypothetical protein